MNWREEREDITVKTVKEVEEFEYLLWVRSMGSFDKRSQKIVQSFSKIMNVAGINYHSRK